jgi:ABC-type transport system involved in cytochrome c biogenesis permease subunit
MQSKPIALTILDILSIIALGVATYFALVFAPTEAVMGNVQRVFYFHVGSAWVGWSASCWRLSLASPTSSPKTCAGTALKLPQWK